MQQNEKMTLDTIKQAITEYAADPSATKVQHILTVTSGLTKVERAEAVGILVGYANIDGGHKMSKSELNQEISRLLTETDEDSDFFDGHTLLPLRVVETLMSDTHYLTSRVDAQLRIYEKGVYLADDTRRTARRIIRLLDEQVTPFHISSVISLLEDMTMQAVDRHTDWINFANGRLCLKSWELLEHSPFHYSTLQLPATYDPNAKCPEFDKWLANVLPDPENQYLLLQLFGYSMLQDVRFGKIVVLYGPTHTGKSTCLDLLKAFLGAENVSALTLHALDNEERRFTRSGLVNKLANLSADLSSKHLAGDSQIKQISVGDPMQVEFKGVQSFSYSPFATLWASCNQFPVSYDRTDAWYERLVILPFFEQHTGKQADRNLLKRLTQPTEISGILNHVLDALKTLLDENVFRLTSFTDELLDEYRIENDNALRFLLEEYEINPDWRVYEETLYKHYVEWCEDEGIKIPLPKARFREVVLKWGPKRIRTNENGKRFFAFEGMRNITE